MNHDINYEQYVKYKEYICIEHDKLKKETIISPCRGICSKCKHKKVGGYSNPDHIANPFGYLYLIPKLCISCSDNMKKCMWCE